MNKEKMPEETLEELYPESAKEFFRAEDLPSPLTLKIDSVEIRKLKDDKKKLVLSFENQEKKLVVNKTNSSSLAEKFGTDYGKWAGKSITIASVPVTFAGKNVKGIRIVG